MSSEGRKRATLLGVLAGELRRFGDADGLYAEALAARLGLNPTDLRCLTLLEQHGAVTAGRLAELTGLTSGAVTGLVDRLERAGFVRRVRDEADRRQVKVEAAREKAEVLQDALAPLHRALAELGARFSEAELERVVELLRAGAGVLQGQAAALREAGAGGEAAQAEGLTQAPLAGATRGRLRFGSGLAQLTLRGEPRLGALLYRAAFTGRPPQVKLEGPGLLTLRYPRFGLLDWRKLGADLALNASIPWDVELKGGASKLEAHLEALVLGAFELTGGASEVTVALPRPKGVVPVRLAGGASRVTLTRPRGAAARLEVKGGASKLAFDAQRFGAVGGTTRLQSPGWDEAADRYDIEVTGGSSELTVLER